MVESGAQVFQRLGCATCHRSGSGARGPILDGLLGRRVRLRDGRVVVADEAYIRQSILEPASQVVAGYEPIMPAFRGQISEEALLQLLAYIRSRAGSGEGPVPPPAGPAGSSR
jgi:cytochrome c oxidase subunit 2